MGSDRVLRQVRMVTVEVADFEAYAGYPTFRKPFGWRLADVGDVIEDQQLILVELGEPRPHFRQQCR